MVTPIARDSGGASPLFAKDETADGCGLDCRHGDGPLAEMLDKKLPDHSATPPTGALRQTPDVAHMGIEARQLPFDSGIAGRILQRHAAGFEYLQKMAQRRLQLVVKTADRVGAGTRRQVFREKTHNDALADRFQVIPLLAQPMGEVRDAAQIGALSVRRISPSLQLFRVVRNVGPKNTALQPGAGLWLNDNHVLHADLLPS